MCREEHLDLQCLRAILVAKPTRPWAGGHITSERQRTADASADIVLALPPRPEGEKSAVVCRGLVKKYERGPVRARRARPRGARRRVLRPARPERRRQDHHRRDPRGSPRPDGGRRRGARACAGRPTSVRCASASACRCRRRTCRTASPCARCSRCSAASSAAGAIPTSSCGRCRSRRRRASFYEKLSGGQKQRLAVACALVGDPELLFLDEPTTGLDPQSRRQLWDVIAEFKREGRTVLLTTHYMEEAERLCDRVAVVDHGKVIALGTPRELIASLGGQEVIEVTLAGDADARHSTRSRSAGLPGVHGVRRTAGGFALAVDALHVALPALLDHLRAARPAARAAGDPPRDARGRVRRPHRARPA